MRDSLSTTILRVRAVLPISGGQHARASNLPLHTNQPTWAAPRRAAFFMEKIAMRGPCTFRKRDVTRAIQAVVAAGVEGRVEIEPNGKIAIVIGKQAALGFLVPNAANDNTWSDVDAA